MGDMFPITNSIVFCCGCLSNIVNLYFDIYCYCVYTIGLLLTVIYVDYTLDIFKG